MSIVPRPNSLLLWIMLDSGVTLFPINVWTIILTVLMSVAYVFANVRSGAAAALVVVRRTIFGAAARVEVQGLAVYYLVRFVRNTTNRTLVTCSTAVLWPMLGAPLSCFGTGGHCTGWLHYSI